MLSHSTKRAGISEGERGKLLAEVIYASESHVPFIGHEKPPLGSVDWVKVWKKGSQCTATYHSEQSHLLVGLGFVEMWHGAGGPEPRCLGETAAERPGAGCGIGVAARTACLAQGGLKNAQDEAIWGCSKQNRRNW